MEHRKRQDAGGLTRDTWVHVICSEFWLLAITCREPLVWVVDSNNLAANKGDFAIKAQGLDLAAVGFELKLSDRDLSSDRFAINVVTRYL